jgi:SNF2 family DNA or RNA helicase
VLYFFSQIQSLLAFLQVSPLSDKKLFNQMVTQEIMNKKEIGLARLRTAMAHVALRRTKEGVNLPHLLVKKTVEICSVDFEEGIHKQTHDVLYTVARAVYLDLVEEAAASETGITHNAFIFGLVHYLRIACCHAGLVDAELVERANMIPIREGHLAGQAVEEVVEHLAGRGSLLKDVSRKYAASSPKINALLESFNKMKPDEKGVVFSEVRTYTRDYALLFWLRHLLLTVGFPVDLLSRSYPGEAAKVWYLIRSH